MKAEYKCKKCGYEWESKKDNPKRDPRSCPSCKSYKWNEIQDLNLDK